MSTGNVLQAVENINLDINALFEDVWSYSSPTGRDYRAVDCASHIQLEYISTGLVETVLFMGIPIWDNQDGDQREYVDSHRYIREPIEPYLRREVAKAAGFMARLEGGLLDESPQPTPKEPPTDLSIDECSQMILDHLKLALGNPVSLEPLQLLYGDSPNWQHAITYLLGQGAIDYDIDWNIVPTKKTFQSVKKTAAKGPTE